MKRFKPDLAYNFLGKGIESVNAAFSESESGEFVFHSDVIALEQENERIKAELSQAKADQERFVWWFTIWGKGLSLPPIGYVGAKNQATLDQWRTYIDEQRAKG